MNPQGTALINKELIHTTRWPGHQLTINGVVDMEKQYKEALSGSIVTVMELSCDKTEYLVLCQSKEAGDFLWSIDVRDVRAFVPVIKKYGTIMPANLSLMEEFAYLAKTMKSDFEQYTK